jgi:hypothetical protein
VYLPLRPSERDRLRAVGVLRKGYLDGRLSTQTFEARVAVAQRAPSRAELRALLSDLSTRWLAARSLLDDRAAHRPSALWATIMLTRCPYAELVVGRSRRCDVVFGDNAVSRRHARFERAAGGWYVRDLGSTNGTYVEDVRVDRAPVAPGSRVRLGDAFLDIH